VPSIALPQSPIILLLFYTHNSSTSDLPIPLPLIISPFYLSYFFFTADRAFFSEFAPLLFVALDADHLRASPLRMARVGIENVQEYLEDGITGGSGRLRTGLIRRCSVQEFAERLERKRTNGGARCSGNGEVEAGAMRNSIRIPLEAVNRAEGELDRGNFW